MIITPSKNYLLGELGSRLQKISEREQAIAKAQAHAQVKTRSFTVDNITVSLLEAPSVENNCIKVTVNAEINGKPLTVDNPLYFYNPPIMIPDGTTYQSMDQVGNAIHIHNYKEDVEGAFRQMIIRLIKEKNNL